jgi:hypothetical protein
MYLDQGNYQLRLIVLELDLMCVHIGLRLNYVGVSLVSNLMDCLLLRFNFIKPLAKLYCSA